MQKTKEKPNSNNDNSLAPSAAEKRLQELKAAVYDAQKQIQFLTQVQIPDLEHQIVELTRALMGEGPKLLRREQ